MRRRRRGDIFNATCDRRSQRHRLCLCLGRFRTYLGRRSPLCGNGWPRPCCARGVMKRRAQAVLADRRQPRRRRLPDRRRAPRRRRETDQAPAGCPDLQVRWTPTGISLSVDGLTINADHATNNQYGQRAFVSVGSGDRLCYSQRINLDDPHQRLTFIGKLRLSCEQAGMTHGVLTLVEDCVTPGLLVKLGDECRRRRAKPDPDPQAEKA